MKQIRFPELPEWVFEVEEMSANVFRVRGRDLEGRSVERTGTDPEAVLTKCRSDAREVSSD
jgi:hypothetical protein